MIHSFAMFHGTELSMRITFTNVSLSSFRYTLNMADANTGKSGRKRKRPKAYYKQNKKKVCKICLCLPLIFKCVLYVIQYVVLRSLTPIPFGQFLQVLRGAQRSCFTFVYSGHFTVKIGSRQYGVCRHCRVSSDR